MADYRHYNCFGGPEGDPQIVRDAAYIARREREVVAIVQLSKERRSLIKKLSTASFAGMVSVAAFSEVARTVIVGRHGVGIHSDALMALSIGSLSFGVGVAAAGIYSSRRQREATHSYVEAHREETDMTVISRLSDPSIETALMHPVLDDYNWLDYDNRATQPITN